MKNTRARNWRRIGAILGLAILFTVCFFIIGLFIDIQILLEYDYNPFVPFTFALPVVGAIIGTLLAVRISRPPKVAPQSLG